MRPHNGPLSGSITRFADRACDIVNPKGDMKLHCSIFNDKIEQSSWRSRQAVEEAYPSCALEREHLQEWCLSTGKPSIREHSRRAHWRNQDARNFVAIFCYRLDRLEGFSHSSCLDVLAEGAIVPFPSTNGSLHHTVGA